MIKNRQSAALSLNKNQEQVIISGLLGEGCITTNTNSTYFITICYFRKIPYQVLFLQEMEFRGHPYME